MKLYLAGPMSNRPKFNVPAFMAGRDYLVQRGYEVQLPADLDDPVIVAKLMESEDGHHTPDAAGGLTWGDCLAMDVKLIADVVDGVAVLPGWQGSRGAKLETFVANLCGKPILYADTQEDVDVYDLQEAWSS